MKRPILMNRTLLIALAALGVGAAGCGRAAVPPGDASAVANAARVELHSDHAPFAHEQVGLVQAFGAGHRATHADVLQALREEGARMGCDAVVRVSVHVGVKNAHAIGVCARRSAEERTADARD